ncbi:RIMS binding protein isoform X2 [Musca autumnalis]|uniref:RIMS binding protein isoform X2 n=1 Tax=Musca autumnalis TaxID=221902 RepID=UPI003CF029CF
MPYERMHHTQLHQTTTGNGMMDSLSLQLRDAETRRAEIERAHQETLAQIRTLSSSSSRQDLEAIENLQSRARELEKKAALENVRCEELQIELSAAMKTKSARSSNEADLHNMAEMRNAAEMRNLNEMRNIQQEMRNNAAAAAAANAAASNMRNMSDMRNAAELRNMTASDMRNLTEMRNISEMRQMDMRHAASDMRSAASDMRNATSDMRNMSDMRSTIGSGVTSSAPPVSSGTTTSVTWAPTIGREDQGSEIDIIMAKIEQDNRVLAELEHPRTSAALSAMPSSSILNTNSEFKTISKTELEEELNRYKRAVLGGTTGVTAGTIGSSALTGYSSALTSSLPNGSSAPGGAVSSLSADNRTRSGHRSIIHIGFSAKFNRWHFLKYEQSCHNRGSSISGLWCWDMRVHRRWTSC